MTAFTKSMVRASVVLGLLVGGLVLTSCDFASAGNTAILNANSEIPPIVRHRFEYAGDEVTDGEPVEVLSSIQSADLDAILTENGFSRSDVVSAQVDSVSVERLSDNTLSGALHLGTDANDPLIANVQLDSGEETTVHDTKTVTDAVKSGSRQLFAQFDVEDSNSGGMVRAKVYYRLELEGV